MTRTVLQAEASKREADLNIDRKLNILDGWVSHGIPFRQTADGATFLDVTNNKQLDFFPASLRQFKSWNGSQNCNEVRQTLPQITATGNDTLAKRPAKMEHARRVIVALRERAKTQATRTNLSELKRMSDELKIANLTIDIRNAEIREQQRSLQCLRTENQRLLSRHNSDTSEFRRVYSTLSDELDKQRRENATLVARLIKVRPLNSASVEDSDD